MRYHHYNEKPENCKSISADFYGFFLKKKHTESVKKLSLKM